MGLGGVRIVRRMCICREGFLVGGRLGEREEVGGLNLYVCEVWLIG